MKLDQKTFGSSLRLLCALHYNLVDNEGILAPPHDMFGFKVPDTTHWRMLSIIASGGTGFAPGCFFSSRTDIPHIYSEPHGYHPCSVHSPRQRSNWLGTDASCRRHRLRYWSWLLAVRRWQAPI